MWKLPQYYATFGSLPVKKQSEEKVDLRFYNVPGKSFHPKAYIFEFDDEDEGEIYIVPPISHVLF